MIQTHRYASRKLEETEVNILSLAITNVKIVLPFVCEAKFSNSAGYAFMVFDDEAGMSYALIECVAIDQSNYIRKQKPRAFGSPNSFGSSPRGGGGSGHGGGVYPGGGAGNTKRGRRSDNTPAAGMPQQNDHSMEGNNAHDDEGTQALCAPYPPGYAHANSDYSTTMGSTSRKPPPRG
jgi:hypothetical protein